MGMESQTHEDNVAALCLAELRLERRPGHVHIADLQRRGLLAPDGKTLTPLGERFLAVHLKLVQPDVLWVEIEALLRARGWIIRIYMNKRTVVCDILNLDGDCVDSVASPSLMVLFDQLGKLADASSSGSAAVA